ncbi:alpha-amylase family protein [Brachybacterium huguangmaarense]|uniref:Alpha-amylase family protein n=1 Tax=Brachybacterium huguangmaarense TaxID=1652028 RepID=A0ABY6G4I8_9MICO|nr:alpha-amylase family protein [Brachybacterium huguangmaarense]UYG17554.1 alpha-amylase family protein [Brachybacterium huguangmaarense]
MSPTHARSVESDRPDPHLARSFDLRVARYGADLRRGLHACYGERADETFERVLQILAAAMAERSEDLRGLDEERLLAPDWLQDPRMLAYVAYADRFAGTLRGVEQHLDHLESLAVTHLHLMPLLDPRPGDSDGGYAVRDFRRVREDLGTMDDLAALATSLHDRGMSLELDLVLNHVAQEHDWARRARAGEERYRDYFLTYPDRTEPDRWEQTLPEVFPDFAPGNFTFDEELGRWVWTTFNAFQWDLNWANPDVFCEFVEIICFLANQGVDVLRLDAIAFTWKRLGTTCQNLPEVHHLTRALRAAARIAAPAVAFKAEAIVGPQDLIGYLGLGEHAGKVSDMAYHNSYMVQLWSALASRSTRLLEVALGKFPPKPSSTTWATYVRCHDDIGWAVTDEDAADAGLSGHAHRAFLSEFYSGAFPGSFAQGLVFQHNPATGDKRISGTLASLAGLERALGGGTGIAAAATTDAADGADPAAVHLAIDRILLLHAAMLGFGGLPLLYMGDEVALLNDDRFAEDPDHAADNRWAHRPVMPWDAVAAAEDDARGVAGPTTPAAVVLTGLRHLIAVRSSLPQLHASVESTIVPSPDHRLLILRRDHPLAPLVEVFNLSEYPVELETSVLTPIVGDHPHEAIGGHDWSLEVPRVTVRPYQALWLVGEER